MMRDAAIILLATLAAGGCAATPAIDDDRAAQGPVLEQPDPLRTDPAAEDPVNAKERAFIVAEVTAYYDDLTAGRWDDFARHFWRGAVVMTVWQPEDGSERRVDFISVPEFIAQLDLGPDSTMIFEQELGTADVHFHGNVAQAWVHYYVRFGEPGDVHEWADVDAFTLMKFMGMWKITSLAFGGE